MVAVPTLWLPRPTLSLVPQPPVPVQRIGADHKFKLQVNQLCTLCCPHLHRQSHACPHRHHSCLCKRLQPGLKSQLPQLLQHRLPPALRLSRPILASPRAALKPVPSIGRTRSEGEERLLPIKMGFFFNALVLEVHLITRKGLQLGASRGYFG